MPVTPERRAGSRSDRRSERRQADRLRARLEVDERIGREREAALEERIVSLEERIAELESRIGVLVSIAERVARHIESIVHRHR